MALEDLTKRILDDATARADAIMSTARATAASIEQRSEQQQKQLREEFQKETEALCAQALLRAREQVAQETRTIVESAQRTALDATFEAACEALSTAQGSAYQRVLQSALARVQASGEPIEHVYAPVARVAETEAAFRSEGIAAPVTGRADIRGGFVAVGAICEYDARFEHMIAHVQRTHEPEIANMLFAA